MVGDNRQVACFSEACRWVTSESPFGKERTDTVQGSSAHLLCPAQKRALPPDYRKFLEPKL